MNNCLSQGCTMALTLFKVYVCVVGEKWTVAGKDEAGVGGKLLNKLAQQLFKRSTRGDSETSRDKREFDNYVVLVVSTSEVAEAAGRLYVRVSRMLGLTVNLPKTKFMVIACGVTDNDTLLMQVERWWQSGMRESVSLLGLLNN